MFTLDRSSILMVGSTTVVVAPRRVRCALISSEAVIFWEKNSTSNLLGEADPF